MVGKEPMYVVTGARCPVCEYVSPGLVSTVGFDEFPQLVWETELLWLRAHGHTDGTGAYKLTGCTGKMIVDAVLQ